MSSRPARCAPRKERSHLLIVAVIDSYRNAFPPAAVTAAAVHGWFPQEVHPQAFRFSGHVDRASVTAERDRIPRPAPRLAPVTTTIVFSSLGALFKIRASKHVLPPSRRSSGPVMYLDSSLAGKGERRDIVGVPK